MEINLLGLVAALTAFISIWLGHVAVRKVEAVTVHLWKPMFISAALGLTLEATAAATPNRPLSTVLGILGMTLLWDVLEIKRQARCFRKGHAPANLGNPRHAALLAEPGSHATTLELLKREPAGRPVSQEEAFQLVADR